MSVSRPDALQVGDRIHVDGAEHTVVGFDGASVILATSTGATRTVTAAELLTDEDFEVVGRGSRVSLATPAALAGLPDEEVDRACWWEGHLVEVLTGFHPEGAQRQQPDSRYDPRLRTLAERDEAKAEELRARGENQISRHTVRRKRKLYEAHGLAGVIDRRLRPQISDTGRNDPRLVDALRQMLAEATDSSTRTAKYYFDRLPGVLAERYGEGTVAIPTISTFYRLFDKLARGRHITGSARTRRSLANRPDGPFGQVTALRPGELVQIDSTALDVMVLLDRGVPSRVDLTAMVDLATRTLMAATLVPTTKSVDASILLARAVTPEPMRPGWLPALRMARSVMPYQRMLAIDERLEAAAARPVILPETIVCDRGNVYISQNFRSACAALGINFQPAHPHTPTDKPHIERTLGSVATLFFQHVSGYLGSSVEHRGTDIDTARLWSIHEMQELLDEWIVAGWQNRPHDGLRDPSAPGRAFTPNERYAVLVESAGYLPLALSPEDYIELLPTQWRAINAYGVKLRHRTYDGPELNPLRGQPSGVKKKNDLWEIRFDPYDITRVWVRDHRKNAWITLLWKHLGNAPAPFGEVAWDHAIRALRDQGGKVSEETIAEAVRELLERAHRGPNEGEERLSPRERQIVAREQAAPRQPRLGEASPAKQEAAAPEEDDNDFDNVIPLRVFDARREAETW